MDDVIIIRIWTMIMTTPWMMIMMMMTIKIWTMIMTTPLYVCDS